MTSLSSKTKLYKRLTVMNCYGLLAGVFLRVDFMLQSSCRLRIELLFRFIQTTSQRKQSHILEQTRDLRTQ